MYLTQGLHRAVQQRPDACATVRGQRRRTNAESVERIARLAGGLRGLGVEPGDRVAMLALNSDRFHEYLLAVPWADAVLNPVNIRWSAAEISYSLADSGTRVLIVDDAFAEVLPHLRGHLDIVIHAGDGPAPEGTISFETLVAETEPVDDARRGGDALLGVFYTGGTTGHPKGVMLSHANLLTSITGVAATGWVFGPGGRFLHVAPMFHLAGLSAWAAGVVVGGTQVILPGFDAAAALAAITEHGITDLLLVPTMLQLLVDHPEAASHDLGGIRTVLYGASPITQAVLERAMKALPNAGFTQAYGMTELSPMTALLGPDDHHHPELLRAAGRAAPHAEILIVDPGTDEEVPRGEVGEIVARGGHVMQGYWGDPEQTAGALRDGWMHTGDGGRMDDRGYVFVVDRLKDMIVTGGENVYSSEVENALATHPAVVSCAVIGLPDDDWGERVHAVVVAAAGHVPGVEELRAHVKEYIAGYKAPRSVDLVDELPLSSAGKVLKRELRRRYESSQETEPAG